MKEDAEEEKATEPAPSLNEKKAEEVEPAPTEGEKADFLKEESSDEAFQQKYFRALADMENMRKRLLRDQKDAVRIGIQKTVLMLLSPIDRFEEALAFSNSSSDEVKNWAVGFKMILQQFQDSLAEQGIKAFSPDGAWFDPSRHDAIEGIETSDVPPGTIVKVFSKGYMMQDRVIRPARVAVAQEIKSKSQEEETNSQDSVSEGINNN